MLREFREVEIVMQKKLGKAILALFVLLLTTVPLHAGEYIFFESRNAEDMHLSFENRAQTRLQSSGIPEPSLKKVMSHLGAAKVSLSEDQARKFSIDNPDTLLIPADMKLYPSILNLQEEPGDPDVPWHVLLSQELQEFSFEREANYDQVRVFVLDTGINESHQDLNSNIEMEYAFNFAGPDSFDVTDVHGHGTNVAGVVAGSRTGVCPDVQLIPLKVANDRGGLSLGDLTESLDYIIALSKSELSGKKIIINLSYNSGWSYSPNAEFEEYFEIIFSSLEAENIIFVSSSGNDGQDIDLRYVYPTSNENPNYLAAGSINSAGQLSYFSNYGETTVEIAAPGSEIITTGINDVYTTVSGTSFSSPFLTGIAAVIWSIDPSLEYWEVRNLVINAVKGQEISDDFMAEYRGNFGDFLFDDLAVNSSEVVPGEIPLHVIAGRSLYPDTVANDPTDPDEAYDPYPADGQGHLPLDLILTWSTGSNVTSCDLTLSDDLGIVLSDDNITSDQYSLSGLSMDKTYKWRIDTLFDGEKLTGENWTFSTIVPGAYEPFPVDNAVEVQTEDLVLKWLYDIQGSSFELFLGTSKDLVENEDPSVRLASSIQTSEFNAGLISDDTIYFWKVNTLYEDPSSNSIMEAPGEVWEFSTISDSDDGSLVHSGGGGGGCSLVSGLEPLIFILLPLLYLMLKK